MGAVQWVNLEIYQDGGIGAASQTPTADLKK